MIYYLNIAVTTPQGAKISTVNAIDVLTEQGFTITDFSVLPTVLVLLVLERGGRRGRDVYSAFFKVAESFAKTRKDVPRHFAACIEAGYYVSTLNALLQNWPQRV